MVYNFIFSPEYESQKRNDKEFVNDLYTMFMGRRADDDGYKFWCGEMEKGMTREEVFGGFANSDEFYKLCNGYGITAGFYTNDYDLGRVNNVNLFVERLYKTCLGRLGDQGGQKYWVEGMLRGELTGVSCAQKYVFSEEYISKGLTNGQYVDNLYRAIMGRESDSDGRKYWVDSLNNGTLSRDQVFEGFAKSPEFRQICESYGINVGEYSATDFTKSPADASNENTNANGSSTGNNTNNAGNNTNNNTGSSNTDTNGTGNNNTNNNTESNNNNGNSTNNNTNNNGGTEYTGGKVTGYYSFYNNSQKIVNKVNETIIDKNGRAVSSCLFGGEELISTSKYEYNADGSLAKDITEYEESKKVVNGESVSSAEVRLTYSNGRLVSEEMLTDGKRDEYWTIEYDSNGRESSIYRYILNNTDWINRYVVENNANSQIGKITQYDKDNKICRQEEYTYDEKGVKTAAIKILFSSGTAYFESIERYSYDSWGRLTKLENTSRDLNSENDAYTSEFIYEYDFEGPANLPGAITEMGLVK